MTDMKKITVVMATYNGMRWLPEQIESLRSQSDPCYDVLIQDDGSGDGTMDWLELLTREDPRFRLAKENGCHFGAAGNFLSLLRQTDAPLIALCDQDDVWLQDRLSACRTAMKEAEARVGEDIPLLIHSDAMLTDENGNPVAESFFAHQGWDGRAVTLNRLLVQNNATGCTMLINRALADLTVSHADPERIFMHDWFLAQTAAAFGEVIFLPRALVKYRQHGSNAMGASRKGLVHRAVSAMKTPSRIRERIALTYQQAEVLLDAYGDELPPDSAAAVQNYLETRSMLWGKRVAALRQGGYWMQNPLTRTAQIMFGGAGQSSRS